MTRAAALILALTLCACGQPAPDGAARPPAAAEAPAPGLVADPKAMPVAFHGVWAATDADCAPASPTRLEIAADRLRFADDSGPVARVEALGPAEVRVAVPLEGQGAEGQRTFRYRLIEDGQALFDVRSGLTRRRCPAPVH